MTCGECCDRRAAAVAYCDTFTEDGRSASFYAVAEMACIVGHSVGENGQLRRDRVAVECSHLREREGRPQHTGRHERLRAERRSLHRRCA